MSVFRLCSIVMHYNYKKKILKKKEIPTDPPNNFQLCNRKQTFFLFGLRDSHYTVTNPDK